MLSRPRKHRNSTVIGLLILLVATTAAQAQVPCDAVLKFGVFDEQDTLNLRQRYAQISRSLCSSGTGLNVSLKDFTGSFESREMCDKEFQSYGSTVRNQQRIRTASKAILDSWNRCLDKNDEGLYHYIQTHQDPRQFTYRIVYATPQGETSQVGSVVFKSAGGGAIACLPHKEFVRLTSGTQAIKGTGLNLNCVREDPTQPVTVTVSKATRGAIPGSIELPALEPDTVLLSVDSIDDGITCDLTHGNTAAQTILTANISSPAAAINVPLRTDVRNTLRCSVTDVRPNGAGSPEWHVKGALYRNGNVEPSVKLADRCNGCNFGATNGKPPVLVKTYSWDLQPYSAKVTSLLAKWAAESQKAQ